MLTKSSDFCVVGVSLMLLLALGCGDTGVVDAEPRDVQLASQIVSLVENEFLNLGSNHPITARYGEFVSLVPGKVLKVRALKVFDQDYPAHLKIYACECAFAKHKTRMHIEIFEGTGPKVTLSVPGSLSEWPVSRDSELWIDRGNIVIQCRVTHPDFQP